MAKTSSTRRSSPRKDPLLPQTHPNNYNYQGGKCAALGRLCFLLLPIWGCAMILTVLYLGAYHIEVPITECTVSDSLAHYTPYWQIILPLSIGALIMFIVTISRNIQISVYHRRLKSETKCMRFMNFLAAVANITSYVGFIILAVFPIDAELERDRRLHMIGAYIYFSLSCVYGIFHTTLIFQQTHYPLWIKIVLTLVAAATVACSAVYAALLNDCTEAEWFAVAFAAIYVALFSILFYVDPVDDEIRAFFCCRRKKQLT